MKTRDEEQHHDAQNDLIEMQRDRDSTEQEQREAEQEWARIESMMLHGE